MFTYSHLNTPIDQQEHSWWLSYFINVFNLQKRKTIDDEIQFCSEDVLLEILKSKVRVNELLPVSNNNIIINS